MLTIGMIVLTIKFQSLLSASGTTGLNIESPAISVTRTETAVVIALKRYADQTRYWICEFLSKFRAILCKRGASQRGKKCCPSKALIPSHCSPRNSKESDATSPVPHYDMERSRTAQDLSLCMPTFREYRAKSENRCVVTRRVFEALCAQYPDKYVVLVQPHFLDDPPDDLTVPKTAG